MNEWILLGHIFFATVWFGGHIYIEGLFASAGRAGDNATMAITAAQVGKVSGRIFPITTVLTLVFGVWLILLDGSVWEFSDVFVSIGFFAVIVGMGIGIFYLTPKDKQVSAWLEERGPDDAELQGLISNIKMVNHVMTLLVVVALIAMVIKPGL